MCHIRIVDSTFRSCPLLRLWLRLFKLFITPLPRNRKVTSSKNIRTRQGRQFISIAVTRSILLASTPVICHPQTYRSFRHGLSNESTPSRSIALGVTSASLALHDQSTECSPFFILQTKIGSLGKKAFIAFPTDRFRRIFNSQSCSFFVQAICITPIAQW